MNRNEEYQALLAELESVPPALETTVDRAVKRETASRHRWRLLGIPVRSLAACFTVFVLLVNLFPPFAAACGNVPLLRQVAKAVAWSPSLSAAVDNEFVQPMGLYSDGKRNYRHHPLSDRGPEAGEPLLTLEGEGYESLSAEMPAFSPEQVCAVMGVGFSAAAGDAAALLLGLRGPGCAGGLHHDLCRHGRAGGGGGGPRRPGPDL
ncbi:MAG: hypothetical protein V8R40_03325 [Dysosmobacter sp.]